VFPVC